MPTTEHNNPPAGGPSPAPAEASKKHGPKTIVSRSVLIDLHSIDDKLGPEAARALVETHLNVNSGAHFFQDLLLTMKGGIGCEGVENGGLAPSVRKSRRTACASAWLSVELPSEKNPIPEKFIITSSKDKQADRCKKLIQCLELNLKKRGMPGTTIAEWAEDLSSMFLADIAEGSCWVDRAAKFEELWEGPMHGLGLSRSDVVGDYLHLICGGVEQYFKKFELDENSIGPESNEPAFLDAKELNCAEAARGFLSSRFGRGKKTDFFGQAELCRHISNVAEAALADKSIPRTPGGLFALLPGMPERENALEAVTNSLKRKGPDSQLQRFIKKLAEPGANEPLTDEGLKELGRLASGHAQSSEEKGRRSGQRIWADIMLEAFVQATNVSYYDANGKCMLESIVIMLDNALRSVVASTTNKANREKCRQAGLLKLSEASEKFSPGQRASLARLDEASLLPDALANILPPVVARWQRDECRTAPERLKSCRPVINALPERWRRISGQATESLCSDGFAGLVSDNAEGAPFKLNQGSLNDVLDYVRLKDGGRAGVHKVPAIRHFDPFLHPCFAQFGASRLMIKFLAFDDPITSNPRGVTMDLVAGGTLCRFDLNFSSKQLFGELGLPHFTSMGPEELDFLPRVQLCNDKFRASAGLRPGDPCVAKGLHEGTIKSNGLLFLSSSGLASLSEIIDQEKAGSISKDEADRLLRKKVNWQVKIALEIEPRGPFLDFCAKHGIEVFNDSYYPKHLAEKNSLRGPDARISLAHMPPGLKITSVDLGLRNDLFISVISTCSLQEVEEACLAAGVPPPGPSDMLIEIPGVVLDNGLVKKKIFLYKRIANDFFLDGTPCPSPFAKIEETRSIKAPGSSKGEVRWCVDDEIFAQHKIERLLGYAFPLIDELVLEGFFGKSDSRREWLENLKKKGWSPSAPIEGAKRLAFNLHGGLGWLDVAWRLAVLVKKALDRHSETARICYYLTALEKLKPFSGRGGSSSDGIQPQEDAPSPVELTSRGLEIWLKYKSDSHFMDTKAEELWSRYIAPLLGCEKLLEAGEKPEGGRLSAEEHNKAVLLGLSAALHQDQALLLRLRGEWEAIWRENDQNYQDIIKKVNRHMHGEPFEAPEGGAGAPGGKGPRSLRRRRGGISKSRIRLLQFVRNKLLISFEMRVKPDGERSPLPPGFAEPERKKIERLKKHHTEYLAKRLFDAVVADPSNPCHVICVEDLRSLLPGSLASTGFNRRSASLAPMTFTDLVKEMCRQHGLLFMTVNPAYTSKLDSRTGEPGIRARAVSAERFMTDPYWRNRVSKARKSLEEGCLLEDAEMLVELDDKYSRMDPSDWGGETIFLPDKGGSLFLKSAAPKSLFMKNADGNAAENIGLSCVRDPDYVPGMTSVAVEPLNKGAPDGLAGPEAPGSQDGEALPAGGSTKIVTRKVDEKRNKGRGDVAGSTVQVTCQSHQGEKAVVDSLLNPNKPYSRVFCRPGKYGEISQKRF